MIFLFSALLPLCTIILHHAYHLPIGRGIGVIRKRLISADSPDWTDASRPCLCWSWFRNPISMKQTWKQDETLLPSIGFHTGVKRVIFQLINALELVCVGLMHVQRRSPPENLLSPFVDFPSQVSLAGS